MAWTAPRTYVTGEVVTASILNTDVRDNLLNLSTHVHGGAAGDGDDQLSGVDDIIFDDVSAPAAPGAGDSRLYYVSGVLHSRVGASGADHPLAPDAKGEILSHDGTVPSQLSVGSDEAVLIADSGETTGLKWSTADVLTKVVQKASDETVNNSTTLQNDDDLLFAMGADETWAFLIFVRHNGGTTPDFSVAITVPTGGSVTWHSARESSGGSHINQAIAVSGHTRDFAGKGADNALVITGTARTGGTSGNLQLQWAQQTADASDSKFLARSVLLAWKVA